MTATPFSKGDRAAKNELKDLLALAGASMDVRTAYVPWFIVCAVSGARGGWEPVSCVLCRDSVGSRQRTWSGQVRDMFDAYAMTCMGTWRLKRVISLSDNFSRPTTIHIPRSILALVHIIH